MNVSRPLGMYFLNEAQREYMDLQLKQERRYSVFENRFDLEKLEDQKCLRRFRFLKKDVVRVVSLLEWGKNYFQLQGGDIVRVVLRRSA